MEGTAGRKLILLTTAIVTLLCMPLATAGKATVQKDHNGKIYEAYVTGRMHIWKDALQEMTEKYRRTPSDSLLYDVLLAQYGLIGYYLEEDRKEEAEALLQEAEGYLEQLQEKPDYKLESLLFDAAFKAFHINLRPRRGMSLGPQSSRLIDQALEMYPRYPRGHLEKGNMLFHAPRLLGGSKKESVKHYERAVTLWERHLPENHKWLYLSTMVNLAKAQKETGELDQAIATLEKALQFEPEFRWVRDELLPEFREKRKNEK